MKITGGGVACGLAAVLGMVAITFAQNGECQWHPLGTGLNGAVGALAVFDDGSGPSLYAGGDFSVAGGVLASNIARWDGHMWHALGTGCNAAVLSLAVYDDGSGPALYVGGVFASAGGVAGTGGIAKWDGQAWQSVGGGVAGGCCPGRQVWSLQVFEVGDQSMLAVGGVFTTAGGANLGRGVVAWNGQAWSGLGGGLNGFYPWASTLAVIQDEAGIDSLLVGGYFANAGGVSGTQNLARWDGQVWHPIGPALNGGVEALGVIPNDDLPSQFVAGGVFTAAGELSASRIVTRTGNNWVPLGGGVDDSVLSITEFVHGDSWQIVVGGEFQTAGGAPAGRIAIWDGSSWRPLSTGLGDISSVVSELATTSSSGASVLYAGGSFSTAGGVYANNIAAWVCLNDSCSGDLNNDGQVNGADISVLLGFWGLNGKPVAADINNDGQVDGADLAQLLGSWGDCP